MKLNSSYFDKFLFVPLTILYLLIPVATFVYETAVLDIWFGRSMNTAHLPFSSYAFWVIAPLSCYVFYKALEELKFRENTELKIATSSIESRGKYLKSLILKSLFILGPGLLIAASLRPRIYAAAAGMFIDFAGMVFMLACGGLYSAYARVYRRCDSIDEKARFEFHAMRLSFFLFSLLFLINLFIKAEMLPSDVEGYWTTFSVEIPQKGIVALGSYLFLGGLLLHAFRFLKGDKAETPLSQLALGSLVSGIGIALAYGYPKFHAYCGYYFPPVAGLAIVILTTLSGGLGLFFSLGENSTEEKLIGHGLILFFSHLLQLYIGFHLWSLGITQGDLSPTVSFITVLGVIGFLHFAPRLTRLAPRKT